MKLQRKYYFVLITFSFCLLGCNKDSVNPLENTIIDESKKYFRDFNYDLNIISAKNLDTNDFKKYYSESQLLKILKDSSNVDRHPFVFIEYDFIYQNIYSLVHFSYDIIEGKVEKVISQWDSDHKMIYTFKTVMVENTLKKKINLNEIIICDIGGELDGYTTTDPHHQEPVYYQGENILCFIHYNISNDVDTTYRTYGMNQGKFTLVQN